VAGLSDVINFGFVAREDDVPAWENVFSVLDAGHQGARFQDAMDVFGDSVTEKLSALPALWAEILADLGDGGRSAPFSSKGLLDVAG
jgi:hypothetical protein